MRKRLEIDKAGRVVIPKPVRDALRLSAGDSLVMDSSGDSITLHPVVEKAALHKKRGVWVYRSEHSLKDIDIVEWIDRTRESRD